MVVVWGGVARAGPIPYMCHATCLHQCFSMPQWLPTPSSEKFPRLQTTSSLQVPKAADVIFSKVPKAAKAADTIFSKVPKAADDISAPSSQGCTPHLRQLALAEGDAELAAGPGDGGGGGHGVVLILVVMVVVVVVMVVVVVVAGIRGGGGGDDGDGGVGCR